MRKLTLIPIVLILTFSACSEYTAEEAQEKLNDVTCEKMATCDSIPNAIKDNKACHSLFEKDAVFACNGDFDSDLAEECISCMEAIGCDKFSKKLFLDQVGVECPVCEDYGAKCD